MTPTVATVLVSALVLVVGLLVFAFSAPLRWPGLVAFGVGLYWLVAVFAHEAVRL